MLKNKGAKLEELVGSLQAENNGYEQNGKSRKTGWS